MLKKAEHRNVIRKNQREDCEMFKKLKKIGIFSLVLAQVAAVGLVAPTSAGAFASPVTRAMEKLDRGVVATKIDNGNLVSWRRLGTEPADTVFTLYRNKEKITEGAITNFVDAQGTVSDMYTVVANGEMSKPAPVWENGYLDIPLADSPESDVVQMDRNGVYIGSYTPGDSEYGDLDGDGEYEIVMLWNPSDAKDAASGGRTGKVFMDAYKLDGTFMWRIDMGWNIRAGQHDTMLNVADFDVSGVPSSSSRPQPFRARVKGKGAFTGRRERAGEQGRGALCCRDVVSYSGGTPPPYSPALFFPPAASPLALTPVRVLVWWRVAALVPPAPPCSHKPQKQTIA